MWYQIDNKTSAKLTDTTTDGNSTYKYTVILNEHIVVGLYDCIIFCFSS